MSKRTIDEVEDGAHSVSSGQQFSKKRKRKGKSNADQQPEASNDNKRAAVNGVGKSEDKKEKKKDKAKKKSKGKEERKEKTSIDKASNGDASAIKTRPEDSNLSKEQRKAAKAARKAARATFITTEINETSNASSKIHTVMEDLNGNEPSEPATASFTIPNPSQSVIDEYLRRNFISIADPIDGPVLQPILQFSDFPLSNAQQRSSFTSFTSSFSAPTPIQAAVWPYLLCGRDCIGVAETGSGKTLAFSVPGIRNLCSRSYKERKVVKFLVLSPTRELAMQIHENINKLAIGVGLTAVCLYGGVPKDEQRRLLKKATIVVATPGRLNDLMEEGSVDLSKAEYLVLDEADRMLDKGFEEDIKKIIAATPCEGRQTLMFTATWPPSVRELASTFMKTPVKINIGDSDDGDLRANARITQKVEVLDHRTKDQRLLQLLREHQSGKKDDNRILVFCLYKKEASRTENMLRSRGYNVTGIHGDLSQAQRTQALSAFKDGKCPLLIATDVAARGLDIPKVKLVINVTFPLTIEDYVHRIGRTGRAGESGLAITLFTEHDKAHSGSLINILKAANQEVPENLLKFGTTVKKKEHSVYGAFYKEADRTKTATKIKFED